MANASAAVFNTTIFAAVPAARDVPSVAGVPVVAASAIAAGVLFVLVAVAITARRRDSARPRAASAAVLLENEADSASVRGSTASTCSVEGDAARYSRVTIDDDDVIWPSASAPADAKQKAAEQVLAATVAALDVVEKANRGRDPGARRLTGWGYDMV